MNSDLYIEKKSETREETDFLMLQKSALELIQQYSGNLWTDFNEHDPGITIMDAFNYALNEISYKAGFPFPDYFTGKESPFQPKSFGLYRPYETYPSAPVTEKDYRKLIFDRVTKITDLWLIPSRSGLPGTIDLLVDLNISIESNEKNRIKKEITEVFHAHRNLCETLGQVQFIDRQSIELKGEITLHDNADASITLAEIYFECARYFTPGIQYSPLRELVSEGKDWPTIFEGPLLENGCIENSSLKPLRTTYLASDIHSVIRKISGVKAIRKLLIFHNGKAYSEEIKTTDPLQSFTIRFPERRSDISLVFEKNNRESNFNFDIAAKYYKKLVVTQFGQHNRMQNMQNFFDIPEGKYQSIKDYFSIQNDFPAFYGINAMGVPSFYSDERKAKSMQLKAYLLIFDLLMADTGMQMEQFPQLFDISAPIPSTQFPDLSSSVPLWEKLIDQEKIDTQQAKTDSFRIQAKHTFFDLLDSLYGEKSYLPLLSEFDTYNTAESTQSELLKQRGNFIRQLPEISHQRAKAVNLLSESPENVPGLKKWFASLLGLIAAQELPMTNIFSKFSLRLLSDDEFYGNGALLNIDFVMNDINENFKNETVFDVEQREVPNPEEHYDDFKTQIYLLQHNILFESLLRNGIDLSRYKIIQSKKNVFILACHIEQQEEWISLGRFISQDAASIAANQLCQFLIRLNQYSENLYIVEHLLLHPTQSKGGYILEIVDEDGMLHFSLLEPASHEQLTHLKNKLGQEYSPTDFFEIKETQENQYVILHKIDEQNALFCQHTFNNREEAEYWIQQFQSKKFLHKVFYQHSESIRFDEDFIDFGLSIIFPVWSARFFNSKFQDYCEELIAEHCPAHLKLNFLWLEANELRVFEKLYFNWREAYAQSMNTDPASCALAAFLAKNMNRHE